LKIIGIEKLKNPAGKKSLSAALAESETADRYFFRRLNYLDGDFRVALLNEVIRLTQKGEPERTS
jgi:hypothetical protein